jgi:hypothetical protein
MTESGIQLIGQLIQLKLESTADTGKNLAIISADPDSARCCMRHVRRSLVPLRTTELRLAIGRHWYCEYNSSVAVTIACGHGLSSGGFGSLLCSS